MFELHIKDFEDLKGMSPTDQLAAINSYEETVIFHESTIRKDFLKGAAEEKNLLTRVAAIDEVRAQVDDVKYHLYVDAPSSILKEKLSDDLDTVVRSVFGVRTGDVMRGQDVLHMMQAGGEVVVPENGNATYKFNLYASDREDQASPVIPLAEAEILLRHKLVKTIDFENTRGNNLTYKGEAVLTRIRKTHGLSTATSHLLSKRTL